MSSVKPQSQRPAHRALSWRTWPPPRSACGLEHETEARERAAEEAQLRYEWHWRFRRQLVDLGERMARLTADLEYLDARATAGKMEPQLSHARALSTSVSRASTVAAGQGWDGGSCDGGLDRRCCGDLESWTRVE